MNNLLRHEFVRFVVIGGSSFVFDIVLTAILITAGIPMVPAGIASFLLVSVYNFTANRLWTFSGSQGKIVPQTAKFGVVSGIGALMHLGIFSGVALISSEWLAAKVVAAGAAMLWNFFGHKYWTFKKVK